MIKHLVAVVFLAGLVAGCGSSNSGKGGNGGKEDTGVTPTEDTGGVTDLGAPDDTIAGEDTGGGSDTPVGEDAHVELSCEGYCKLVTAACTGQNAQYESEAQCLAFCGTLAKLPLGSEGDTSGNTVGCRRYHAGVAAESAEKAAEHCPHAGAAGGGVCGTPCDLYCHLAAVNCTGESALFTSDEECQTACAAIKELGKAGAKEGDSLACRIYHLSVAGSGGDAMATHCPHGGPDGGGVCSKTCTPACDGKQCGDDGCDGTCGTCKAGEDCLDGKCACIPKCEGKDCGDDGCGASCGDCAEGLICGGDAKCAAPGCESECEGKECGTGLCGKSCGACSAGLECSEEGKCIDPETCVPDCTGKECGSDKCGGDCGFCDFELFCTNGKCTTECTPNCTGKQCGDNGCGKPCGTCADGVACTLGGICGNACTSCKYQDGCFESSFENGSLGGWQLLSGIPAIVESLGTATPTDGTYMLQLSTGSGSLSEISSEAALPDCLPDGCYQLSFDMKFYSEEFQEWCGSQYQDALDVTLVQADVPKQLLHWAVDDMCPAEKCSANPACSDHFIGLEGSDVQFDKGEAWKTPWHTEKIGFTLSGGKPFELHFTAIDAGDAIYDTVVLIDNLQFIPSSKSCTGKKCGDDGCGGTCGTCAAGGVCFENQCCTPVCDGKSCGAGSNGCGGACTCAEGSCVDGECCLPKCDGTTCGDDGCGGSCDYTCYNAGGTCVADGSCCTPKCDGTTCGDDGCGGTCQYNCWNAGGTCAADGSCCVPQCNGKSCGDDTCGGSCGKCNDSKACTTDECSADGVCVYTPVADETCCDTAGDCEDGLKCTADVCDETHHCAFKAIPGVTCCTTNAQCDDKDAVCTPTDTCDAGICTHVYSTAEGCCDPSPYSFAFDLDAEDFTLTNSEASGKGWNWTDKGASNDTPGALYYGDPATGNFDFGTTNGHAVSPAVLVPAGTATVSFGLYMATEGGTTYDQLSLTVHSPELGDVLVWAKDYDTLTSTWQTITVDLSAFAGQTVTLDWYFDTYDGAVNGTEGVYLDDIQIGSSCAPRTCEVAADCDDNVSATIDACKAGLCAYSVAN